MLQSMTGFGKAICEINKKHFTIEIRSLNSKQTDFYLKIPQYFKEKETVIRNILSQELQRGKVEFVVQVENNNTANAAEINEELFKAYASQISKLSKKSGLADDQNLVSTILRLPDIISSTREEIDDKEWIEIEQTIKQAIENLVNFRKQEGEVLQKDIVTRIKNIETLLEQIPEHEERRIDKIRERIGQNLQEFVANENIDKNRLEQEVIYYLEKLDITEEKVRLKNHCTYFLSTIEKEDAPGKKLGFISQEIGRETNTIGSKANDSTLQKIVVEMKNELEKIKEQLLNVL